MKIFLALIACLPILVHGWWANGHMLTAAVAEKRLKEINPYVFDKMNELVTSINSLTDDRSHTFIECASWPDDIKEDQYNLEIWSVWHYKDIPFL